MVELLPKEEMKKHYLAFLTTIVIFLPSSLAAAYFMVDAHTFSQYITLPSKIEHNRYVFLIFYVVAVCGVLVFAVGYTAIMRRKLPEKIRYKLGGDSHL